MGAKVVAHDMPQTRAEKILRKLKGKPFDRLEVITARPVESIQAFTRLTEKAYSPLVIRKVTKFGFPIYVGIITDDNLDALDHVIVNFIKQNIEKWKSDSLQEKRNLAGKLCDALTEVFPKTEGIGVVFFIDKCCVSSLFGDMMNHGMCRSEFYALLQMSTAV